MKSGSELNYFLQLLDFMKMNPLESLPRIFTYKVADEKICYFQEKLDRFEWVERGEEARG